MPEATPIDALVSRYRELDKFLRENKEVSLALEAEANFGKLLTMACGSFFEEQITTALLEFAHRKGGNELTSFVKTKAIARQYHTLFVWDAANVNKFLKLFGDPFHDSVAKDIDSDGGLRSGMKAFLSLGERRNQMAHGNIVSLAVDRTIETIVADYQSAMSFVSFLKGKFASL